VESSLGVLWSMPRRRRGAAVRGGGGTVRARRLGSLLWRGSRRSRRARGLQVSNNGDWWWAFGGPRGERRGERREGRSCDLNDLFFSIRGALPEQGGSRAWGDRERVEDEDKGGDCLSCVRLWLGASASARCKKKKQPRQVAFACGRRR
jgi:hypothetical protein